MKAGVQRSFPHSADDIDCSVSAAAIRAIGEMPRERKDECVG